MVTSQRHFGTKALRPQDTAHLVAVAMEMDQISHHYPDLASCVRHKAALVCKRVKETGPGASGDLATAKELTRVLLLAAESSKKLLVWSLICLFCHDNYRKKLVGQRKQIWDQAHREGQLL